MTHGERSKPWMIVRLLPTLEWWVVSRHRRRSDAEEFLRVYRRLFPKGHFELIFDPLDQT